MDQTLLSGLSTHDKPQRRWGVCIHRLTQQAYRDSRSLAWGTGYIQGAAVKFRQRFGEGQAETGSGVLAAERAIDLTEGREGKLDVAG